MRRLPLILLLLWPSSALSAELRGKVVRIADGDTLTVLDGNNTQHKVRLEGIDAPESHQAYGTRSKEALAAKVHEKQVVVEWEKRDKFSRILGHVKHEGHWVNKEMVAEGWAWHFKRYSASKELADAESAARAARVGLWQDKNPQAPWDFRAKRK